MFSLLLNLVCVSVALRTEDRVGEGKENDPWAKHLEANLVSDKTSEQTKESCRNLLGKSQEEKTDAVEENDGLPSQPDSVTAEDGDAAPAQGLVTRPASLWQKIREKLPSFRRAQTQSSAEPPAAEAAEGAVAEVAEGASRPWMQFPAKHATTAITFLRRNSKCIATTAGCSLAAALLARRVTTGKMNLRLK